MKEYDVIVVGGGHAGVEAALVASRMGKKTLMVTLSKDKIANMPCNPSIGGPAKGIVVREIDAIGGEMAKAADKTALQMKLLNSSRVNNQRKCYGVVVGGEQIIAKAVILTTGTYMASVVLRGQEKKLSGPDGEITTNGISQQLATLGFRLIRLKTGTPARIKRDSIDFSKTQPEPGSDMPLAFSYSTKDFLPFAKQELCWLIHSNDETHLLVTENLTKSAMYSGNIVGRGPRYCPSFEDKITRFPDKSCHQIFLEPESKELDTIYVQGFSTSMPIDIQDQMLRTLPGLENCEVVKWAYAIEYDAIDPTQMTHTLESKLIANLYTAGQINGTSGYEEAACQGLMAGINACLKIDYQEPFILRRDEAYIGVLIDDLVTKGTEEPYRLLTSRAEYRLLLRNDNAEERLKHYAKKFGLITNVASYNRVYQLLKETIFDHQEPIISHLKNDGIIINEKISAYNLLKRPDINIKYLEEAISALKNLPSFLKQNLLINIRFEGYIKKEQEIALKTIKLENKKIPTDLNYDEVDNLAIEAREKLKLIKPISIGQANRI
ncbi:unnamed protein product, partial [Ixodes persulcatus]